MYPMAQNIVNAYLELDPTKEERIMILTDHLELMKAVEASAKSGSMSAASRSKTC